MTSQVDAAGLPAWALKAAPCLTDSPYAEQARVFVKAGLALASCRQNHHLKMVALYNIVHAKRALEENPDVEPVAYFRAALLRNAELLQAGVSADCGVGYDAPAPAPDRTRDERTAAHYGNLFSAFDNEKYFDEPVELLRQRLGRNDYPLDKFSQWTGLDAGCGNGRYTVALRKLGMKQVWGIDLSPINIDNAKQRLPASVSGVTYRQASALELPFENDFFDFGFSNGVLHHTPDCAKGVKELLRVMKPSGCGFLKLIGTPGGIHWDHCELLRVVMHDVSFDFARDVLESMNVPPNLRYLFLDHVFAPINYRYTKEEVEKMLVDAGAVKIRWLPRGADFDLTERTWKGEPHADIKYGMGEHRFYFEKP